MAERNPIDYLASQLSELIKMLYEKESQKLSGKPDSELLKKVDELEKAVEFFKEFNNQLVKETGITPEQLRQLELKSPASVNVKQKALLERLKQLKKDSNQLKMGLDLALNRFKKKSPKKRQERKRGFKKMGGSDWIPL